jgi:hypothetical protein
LAGLNSTKEITESNMSLDFKRMLEIMSVQEGKMADIKGKKHSGKYGTEYQGDEDDDDDSHRDAPKNVGGKGTPRKKKEANPAEKKGRGRPKKDSNADADKWKGADDAASKVIGGKAPKGKSNLPSKKHTLKDWIEHVQDTTQLNESDQVSIQPAQANTQVSNKQLLNEPNYYYLNISEIKQNVSDNTNMKGCFVFNLKTNPVTEYSGLLTQCITNTNNQFQLSKLTVSILDRNGNILNLNNSNFYFILDIN